MFMVTMRPLGVALAVVAIVVTACGPAVSAPSPAASAAPTNAASSAPTSETTANAQQACADEAKKLVEEARVPLPVMAPPSAIEMGKLKGKSVWLIAAGQTEYVQTVGDGFVAAGTAAGIDARFVQADWQLNQMQRLVEQATAAQAAGIVLFNITPESVSGPLAQAVNEGITIVDFNNGDPTEPVQAGLFAHVAQQFTLDGKKKADWMLADSGCDLHLATFSVPVLAVVVRMIDGATAEVKRLCPDCKVTPTEFDVSNFATSLGPLAQTVTLRDPTINYIDAAADAFAGVMAPVLQQAGSNVKIVGHDGNPSTLETIAAGNTLLAATVAGPPADFIGWALLDQLGRGMLGLAPADWSLPGRIIDSTNVGAGTPAEIHPGWDNYQAKFLAAWGL